ncbi:MAG: DUF3830 family protein [Chloroflexi bacterium]|nr:DUF3830 family protein [Chloroflexota bacterium]
MMYIDVAFAGLQLRARLLEHRAPATVAAFRQSLPLEGRASQDRYSHQVMRLTCRIDVDSAGDQRYGYQQPGLVMLDPATGELAVCFGRGRLQNALGPIFAIPIAELGGDLAELETRGEELQFQGAAPITFTVSHDQESPLADPPIVGHRMALTLGSARAEAVLLEETSPKATAALAAALPLVGKATNTFASGPLTRFWNPSGGPQGETPLDVPASEVNTNTLYGGGYYLSSAPYRGLRIAVVEPTAMGGGRSALAPVFRFVGDWSAFAAEAATLTMDGQKDLRIEFI